MIAGGASEHLERPCFIPVEVHQPKTCPVRGQSKETLIDHLETGDDVEQRTELDFFWKLPDAEENGVEAVKNLSWAQSWAS